MIRSKEAMALTGTLSAAIAASACCIGPLALAALGLGGAAYAVALEPYRPWLIAATALFLAGSFHLVYGKPAGGACGPDGTCADPPRRTTLKVLLWAVALLAAASVTFPYYVELIT